MREQSLHVVISPDIKCFRCILTKIQAEFQTPKAFRNDNVASFVAWQVT